MQYQDFKTELIKHNINYKEQEPMYKHTSLRLGGNASFFAVASNKLELKTLLTLAKKHAIKLMLIGKGSNLLFKDSGYNGLVIKLGGDFLNLSLLDNCRVYSGAAASLKELANFSIDNSLEGLAFASGIPGNVGGAVVMNAGAYGGEIKDFVEYVDLMDYDGNEYRLSNAEMDFSYRHSILSDKKYIVLGASFALTKGDKQAMISYCQDINKRRAEKQPLEFPSCGSTFKRPLGNFASALIEQCGLKGYRVGGCSVSTKHSGFLLNDKNGSSADFLQLIDDVKSIVYKQTGIILELEVKVID